MNIQRKVAYFLHYEALDGIYLDMPNQYETAEGFLLTFAHNVRYVDEKPFQITEAVIENLETHEIKCIDYRLLKEFLME